MQRRILDAQLDTLREKILRMGTATEVALNEAMQALIKGDAQLAQKVIDGDDEIDQLELDVDQLCVDIFALQAPAARDLRLVLISAKLATILERMRDIVTNIARRTLVLLQEPPLKPDLDLPRMTEIASAMLRQTIEAYTAADSEKAIKVIEKDSRIDETYAQLVRELLTYMVEDPKTITRATQLLFIAKHLERFADQATNACELVVYLKEARVIKHQHAIEPTTG